MTDLIRDFIQDALDDEQRRASMKSLANQLRDALDLLNEAAEEIERLEEAVGELESKVHQQEKEIESLEASA